MISLKRRTLFILLLVFGVGAFGVIGYQKIEGWSISDSLYMTIITLTTTGYQEVHPLSEKGRDFTMILLLVGMGTVAYSVTQLMQELLSINFQSRRRFKMKKDISQLHSHVVICGYGRIGRVVCKELARFKKELVVIEKNPDLIEELENSQHLWVEGDATHDETLIQAGIERASVLACMIDSDADSLYVSLASRSLNKNLHIIARASEESARPKILRAGADKVVLPTLVSGTKVAYSVVNPAIDDLLDIAGVELADDHRIQLAEIPLIKDHKLVGKTLETCQFRMSEIMVVGIRHPDGKFTFAPKPDYEFLVGDTLITLSTHESFLAATQI